jgi:hypothetical protein
MSDRKGNLHAESRIKGRRIRIGIRQEDPVVAYKQHWLTDRRRFAVCAGAGCDYCGAGDKPALRVDIPVYYWPWHQWPQDTEPQDTEPQDYRVDIWRIGAATYDRLRKALQPGHDVIIERTHETYANWQITDAGESWMPPWEDAEYIWIANKLRGEGRVGTRVTKIMLITTAEEGEPVSMERSVSGRRVALIMEE